MATDSSTPGNSQENSPEAQKLQDLDAKWEGLFQKLTSLITNLERTVATKLLIHESLGTSRENQRHPQGAEQNEKEHSSSSESDIELRADEDDTLSIPGSDDELLKELEQELEANDETGRPLLSSLAEMVNKRF